MSSDPDSKMEKTTQQSPWLEGAFDAVWWRAHSNLLGLAIVLLLVLGYLGVKLYQPLFSPASETPNFENVAAVIPKHDMFIRSSYQPTVIYFTGIEKNTSDIYKISALLSPTLTLNLTNSPQYWELWPSPAPSDARLAFIALSATGERSIRVLEPAEAIYDVTYNVGDSGLGSEYQIDLSSSPQWSPDGIWLAFLGEQNEPNPNTLELFVAEVQTCTVYRLTREVSQISAFQWLDNDSIVFSVRRQDGTFALFEIDTSPIPSQPRRVSFHIP